MTPKCRYDCFHCPHPDCIVGVECVSEEERERLLNQQRKVLRSVRIANGLTQQKLAARIGVTDATISAWEHGRSPANWDNLCAVLPELEEYRP